MSDDENTSDSESGGMGYDYIDLFAKKPSKVPDMPSYNQSSGKKHSESELAPFGYVKRRPIDLSRRR